MKCIIPNKVKFINDLNKVIPNYKTGIKKIEYRVFRQDFFKEKFDEKTYYQEYLVITYDGGALGVRSCNGDSFTAIFEELVKMLDGGYYDEVKDLHDHENSEMWKEVSLEELEEDYKNKQQREGRK